MRVFSQGQKTGAGFWRKQKQARGHRGAKTGASVETEGQKERRVFNWKQKQMWVFNGGLF